MSVTGESVQEVLVNCLGGLSLPKKSVVRLTDRPLDVYRGRKTTQHFKVKLYILREATLPFSFFASFLNLSQLIKERICS